MRRWIVRLGLAGLALGLLGYFWSRMHQEYDEDDFEDEIELDFESPLQSSGDEPGLDPPAERHTEELESETPPRTNQDDLTRIVGIGAVFQKRLNEAGISTYKQLAEADPAQLRAPGVEGINVESWIQQAQALAQQTS